MIYQNIQTENTQNKFSDAISELQLEELLRTSNITKDSGIPAYGVFRFLPATKITSAFSRLTRPEHVKVFVIDDTVIKRSRSRAVELPARVYDHVKYKYQKGFTLLTPGWSDGYRFIPVAFNMLSSAKKSNRYHEMSEDIDHRSIGYKRKEESMMKKTMRPSSC